MQDARQANSFFSTLFTTSEVSQTPNHSSRPRPQIEWINPTNTSLVPVRPSNLLEDYTCMTRVTISLILRNIIRAIACIPVTQRMSYVSSIELYTFDGQQCYDGVAGPSTAHILSRNGLALPMDRGMLATVVVQYRSSDARERVLTRAKPTPPQNVCGDLLLAYGVDQRPNSVNTLYNYRWRTIMGQSNIQLAPLDQSLQVSQYFILQFLIFVYVLPHVLTAETPEKKSLDPLVRVSHRRHPAGSVRVIVLWELGPDSQRITISRDYAGTTPQHEFRRTQVNYSRRGERTPTGSGFSCKAFSNPTLRLQNVASNPVMCTPRIWGRNRSWLGTPYFAAPGRYVDEIPGARSLSKTLIESYSLEPKRSFFLSEDVLQTSSYGEETHNAGVRLFTGQPDPGLNLRLGVSEIPPLTGRPASDDPQQHFATTRTNKCVIMEGNIGGARTWYALEVQDVLFAHFDLSLS
ncbi:hypothetical protein AG1IA_07176 [Rhizoctonia solani AG-1 IA]|uniref:Uncharacterized protein n=1 Tax=Thanatephorus cucumeris (strain AG1-IA) TaxID=983506 RepID=L8WPV6_THACA|nr:hypothetical protein AG1IA_07176 [Rhizoctonia solani AG-1 IA]